jgi:flagellar basal-body rod protein FlgB
MTTVSAVSPSAGPKNQHSGHGATSINPSGAVDFSVAMQSARSRHVPTASQTADGHIPINGQPAAQGFHERALNVFGYRLQLIASNIANADTPNYKAVDIDCREALRVALADATHRVSAIPLKYHVSQQGSIDGNTVELDVERAKFADSMVRYQFSLDRISGHYKMMSELLNNIKD